MSDSDEERDVWRSPDGRYRLAARVWDSSAGLRTDYPRLAREGDGWRPCDSKEESDVLTLLARQLDRDAGEERAG